MCEAAKVKQQPGVKQPGVPRPGVPQPGVPDLRLVRVALRQSQCYTRQAHLCPLSALACAQRQSQVSQRVCDGRQWCTAVCRRVRVQSRLRDRRQQRRINANA